MPDAQGLVRIGTPSVFTVGDVPATIRAMVSATFRKMPSTDSKDTYMYIYFLMHPSCSIVTAAHML